MPCPRKGTRTSGESSLKLKEALRQAAEILKREGVEAPSADAGALLCHVLSCENTFLYAHGEEAIRGDRLELYMKAVRDRAARIPVRYITGHREFMSLDFIVTPDVLIPRPETEVLVEVVIELAQRLYTNRRIDILDMGTGSGCIAVSLGHYIKESGILAADISEEALRIARLNAERNGLADRVEFVPSDLFSTLDPRRKLDVIVSNPPYIKTAELETLEPEVRLHEPVSALDGGFDGLFYYRRIVRDAPFFLPPGGCLALETGYDQSGAVAEMLEDRFAGISIIKDLSGIGRVVTGILKHKDL